MKGLVVAVVLLFPLGHSARAQGARAEWRCEPSEVEVGEPFALVLELTHPAGTSGRALASGALELDASWVVLDEQALVSAPAEDGLVRTRRAWRVASLEPGERALGEALSGVALAEEITHIALGGASVRVAGVLAEGEDAARPLRAFPADFVPGAEAEPSALPTVLSVAGVALAVAALVGGLWWRRRRRAPAPEVPSPLERLRQLEAGATVSNGTVSSVTNLGVAEASRERCYALTRLLREAGDGLRARPGSGLSDEEWLAEIRAAHELPSAAVGELTAVLEQAARVKYGGEAPTPWALQETFARARAALEALSAGGARA